MPWGQSDGRLRVLGRALCLKKKDKKKYSSLFIGSEGAERHFHSVFWTKRIQIIGKVLGSMERQVELVLLNIF